MPKINKPIHPTGAKIVNGGRDTMFYIGGAHWENGQLVNDGLTYLFADGMYDFHRGDVIIIRKIIGWQNIDRGGSTFFKVSAEIELLPQKKWDVEKDPTLSKAAEDLPEELL